MLEAGDRVVVGVSGGKDSLVLLRLLTELREHSAVPFTLQAVTLDMGYETMDFSPVTADRAELCFTATNGAENVEIFEIRAYFLERK